MAAEKPVVSKIVEVKDDVANVFSQWWNLTTADKRPQPDPKNLVTINELPVYAEDHPTRSFKFVEEEPLPLQREFATFRKTFNEEYGRVVARFAFVDTAVDKTTKAAATVNRYVQDEWSVLPKAGAITLGGMAGFVLGLKRGSFGRVFFASTGLLTMAAFCYPHETVDVIRTGIAHSEQKWEEFQQSPDVSAPQKPDLSPPKN